MIDYIKNTVDFISTPTISFTFLTVAFPFLFPPTDWFDKVNRRLKLYQLWSKPGFIAMIFMAVHFWRIRKDGGISGPM